jgi:hypothetical protein
MHLGGHRAALPRSRSEAAVGELHELQKLLDVAEAVP